MQPPLESTQHSRETARVQWISGRRKGCHGTSSASGDPWSDLIPDLRDGRRDNDVAVHAVRPGDLADHPTTFHGVRGHSGRLRRPVLLLRLRPPLPFAQPASRLVRPDSSRVRDPRIVDRVRGDRVPLVIRPTRRNQRHDGVGDVQRIPHPHLRRLRGRRRLYDVRAGGDDEREDVGLAAAVLRDFRRVHRRPDQPTTRTGTTTISRSSATAPRSRPACSTRR